MVKNAKVLAEALINEGFRIVSGGTDNHLVAVDVKGSIGLTGKEAEETLDSVGITCNKIPFRSIEKPFCNEWYTFRYTCCNNAWI